MGARGTVNVRHQYAGGASENLKNLTEILWRDTIAYMLRDGVVGGRAAINQDDVATDDLETNEAVRVRINGEEYVVPPTAGIAVGLDTVALNKWIAYFLTVDETKTITVTSSEIGGAGTADTELEAILSITQESDSRIPTGEVLIAIVTLQGLGAGFTGGTDVFNVSDAGVQAINYYDVYESHNGIVTPAASFAQSATTDEMDIGATVAKMNGARVTLAADANFPFSQADTINTAAGAQPVWGGWMIVRNTAGVFHTLAAHGKPIGAGDMAFATKATVTAAMDVLAAQLDRIPIVTEVTRLFVQVTASDVFTANTELLSTADAAVNAIDFDIVATDDVAFAATPAASLVHLKPPAAPTII